MGYQRQWRIHLCCLQKSTRWRHLRRQEVRQEVTLDLNVPCRPTLKCVLWGQHGKCWTQCIIQWVFESRVISVSRLFWTVCFELVQNMIQQFVAEWIQLWTENNNKVNLLPITLTSIPTINPKPTPYHNTNTVIIVVQSDKNIDVRMPSKAWWP